MRLPYYRSTKLYQQYWERISEIYKDMPLEDIEDSQQLIKFHITTTKSKNGKDCCLFHILFVIEMQATDALPSYENLQYCVLHSFWRTSTEVNKYHPNFKKGCKDAKIAIPLVISRALYEETEEAPFTSADWWKSIEAAFFLKYTPPANRTPVTEFFILNHRGECISGESKNMPPVQVRRTLCRNAAKVLFLKHARDVLLCQLPGKTEKIMERNKETPLTVFQHERIPPLHIGWTEELGCYYYNGMNFWKDTSPSYGNAFSRLHPEKWDPNSMQRLFEIVPLETAIPLLAFSLFSIIKYMIPDYPSRISLNDSFQSVRKKQDKLIFLSLKGEHAEVLADAFCGTFTDYGKEYQDKNWKFRVHDGVVIYKENLKSFHKFLNNELLQDASVLCVNPDFERNEHEIVLQCDTNLSDAEYQEVRHIIENTLFHFTAFFTDWFQRQLTEAVNDTKERWWTSYKRLYRSIALKMNYRMQEIQENLDKIYQEKRLDSPADWNYLKDIYPTLIDCCHTLILDNYGIYDYEHAVSCSMQWIKDNKKQQSKTLNRDKTLFYEEIFLLQTIHKYILKEDENDNLFKYSYLYSSLNLFRIFLNSKGIPPNKSEEFRKLFLKILKVMATNHGRKVDPDKVLSQYLSDKIVNHHIIRLRTAPNQNTAGWYDSNKNLIYLPYKTYFDAIIQYWKNINHFPIPYSQKSFQAELSEKGILIAKKTGAYLRPECQITVAPAGIGQQAKEAVIKINVHYLPLTEEANARLEELSKIVVPRRSRSK